MRLAVSVQFQYSNFFFYINEYNFDSFNECGIEIKSVVYVV